MNTPRPIAPPAEASAGAVSVLAALLEVRTGQQMAANRTWRIDTALKPLLAERGLETIDQLVGQLLDGQDRSVGDRIVDALLNQETSFFRDAGVIEAAAAAVDSLGAVRPRIWSAGCASGQEPLSLAMTFAEAGGIVPEIVATDVSGAAIARARAGRFNQFEIQRGLPIRRLMRWFEQAGDDWIASAELLRLISFRRQNLVAERAPAGQFDAVFCRNVLFYLTPALRTQVLDTIADALRPGGFAGARRGRDGDRPDPPLRPEPPLPRLSTKSSDRPLPRPLRRAAPADRRGGAGGRRRHDARDVIVTIRFTRAECVA